MSVNREIESNEQKPIVVDGGDDPFTVRGRSMDSFATNKFATNILIYLGLGIDDEKTKKLVFVEFFTISHYLKNLKPVIFSIYAPFLLESTVTI